MHPFWERGPPGEKVAYLSVFGSLAEKAIGTIAELSEKVLKMERKVLVMVNLPSFTERRRQQSVVVIDDYNTPFHDHNALE